MLEAIKRIFGKKENEVKTYLYSVKLESNDGCKREIIVRATDRNVAIEMIDDYGFVDYDITDIGIVRP